MVRLPSIKTLQEVFGDRAKEARLLLEGKISPNAYKIVQGWVDACYGCPSSHDRLMLALNEVAETHGVEALVDKNGEVTHEYLNAGDTYAATLLYNVKTGSFRVASWGDIVERNPRRYE